MLKVKDLSRGMLTWGLVSTLFLTTGASLDASGFNGMINESTCFDSIIGWDVALHAKLIQLAP